MKKLLIVSLVLFGITTTAFAGESGGNPFQAIWDAINNLQEQITNIQLIPGPAGPQGAQGEQGPIGPQGEPGAPAQHGAGNIAFMPQADEVVTTDGVLWLWSNGWIPDPNAGPVPIPVSDIVIFEGYRFVDINGDVWRKSNLQWINVGHP